MWKILRPPMPCHVSRLVGAIHVTKERITVCGVTVPCCKDEDHREYVYDAIVTALARGGYA